MPLAFDTFGCFATNPGATLTNATISPGDSFVVRNATLTSLSYISRVIRQGATEGYVRILSPLLHDSTRGISFKSTETPSHFFYPPTVKQVVRPQDALVVQLSGGTAETDGAAIGIQYEDLPGAVARLKAPSDIVGNIKTIKPLEVDFTSNATAMNWTDTALTTTENLLHANTDYAVLGYLIDTALCAVGVKGIETANLRACGPAITASDFTSWFFWWLADREQKPLIPVFNSANAPSVFLSAIGVPTGSSVIAFLILAEMAVNLST